MKPVCLAIVWHQHQPSYRPGDARVARLPWVRLHGIKDYVGMALLARRYPEFHHTINLVPCLLDQLEDLAAGSASDEDLELAMAPAKDLTEQQAIALLDRSFMANIDTMIRPHARYAELHARRRPSERPAADALKDFDTVALRDLQVWHTLSWFHPLVFGEQEDLSELEGKGRDFAEKDKDLLFKAQREVLGTIIPLHKELQKKGVLELSTTPCYHPILPLLMDMASARVALPDLPLPAETFEGSADVREQLEEAVQGHKKRFGRKPRGLWPSEGSVSPQIVGPVAEAGFEWLASDEGVLGRSLGVNGRAGDGAAPDWLCAPYELPGAERRKLAAVFRDHVLSDRIGFQYAHAPNGADAAADLLGRIRAAPPRRDGRPALVTIVLDGDNAWEFYPDQGLHFLMALYEGACKDRALRPVTVAEYLDEFGTVGELERLHSGSWIGADFATWVGQTEKNRGWELLARAKAAVERAAGKRGAKATAAARDAIHRAEGSDWFWWYGEGHSSEQDDLFDELFRAHLRVAYEQSNLPVRDEVEGAISETRPLPAQPEFLLDVVVDGLVSSYYEWLRAGYYDSRRDVGAMRQAGGRAVSQLYFGFSTWRFFLRLDRERPASGAYSADWGVRVVFSNGAAATLPPGQGVGGQAPLSVVSAAEPGRPVQGGLAARGRVVELAVPWADLGLEVGEGVEFHVEVFRGDELIQRLPRDQEIPITVPDESFGATDWTA
jgi:alpha-amylase/alpha-mannosidase (GH57 family)